MRGRKTGIAVICLLLFLLCGCSSIVLFHPKGDIGREEKRVILLAGGLMLIVVVPVLVMTPLFAWRYRASRRGGDKEELKPRQARILDMALWLVPAAIVAALGVTVWITAHSLDPFRPIASKSPPVTVQVVSLDWKWLFIYPEQGVASVNEVALPVNVPVHFTLTSDTVMNSFFIPQLGSQMYTMVGMRSELYLIADTPGEYAGVSANISGLGFSGMGFTARALSGRGFEDWVRAAKAARARLDDEEYGRLSSPSMNNPVSYYASVRPGLFSEIIGRYSFDH